MKQTAVEKLEKEIFGRITRRQPHGTIIIQGQEETLIELFQEMKEMEKSQQFWNYMRGWDDGCQNNVQNPWNNKPKSE